MPAPHSLTRENQEFTGASAAREFAVILAPMSRLTAPGGGRKTLPSADKTEKPISACLLLPTTAPILRVAVS